MNIAAPQMTHSATARAAAPSRQRLAIGFLNWAHALDHFVILIYPTLVIELQTAYGRSYSELIAARYRLLHRVRGFLAAGGLACRPLEPPQYDGGVLFRLRACRLSARRLLRRFTRLRWRCSCSAYSGPSTIRSALRCFLRMQAQRGRALAFNAVCGNLGVALAAGVTATLTAALSWRCAFLIPGLVCIAAGALYLRFVPRETRHAVSRDAAADVVAVDACRRHDFRTLYGHCAWRRSCDQHDNAGAAENRRRAHRQQHSAHRRWRALHGARAVRRVRSDRGRPVGRAYPLACAFCRGRRHAVRRRVVGGLRRRRPSLLVALAFTMAAIYGQITLNDLVIARYTADAWRGRVYAVRYFLTFMVSGVAVSMIALALRPRRL